MATELLLREASHAGIDQVYLLAESAAAFFRHLGFKEIERQAAPAMIQNSRQASSLCPASASLLQMRLTPTAHE